MDFQQYYWGYALGILIVSFVLAITIGSFGTEGRFFFSYISQASLQSFIYVFMGGVVFNLANSYITCGSYRYYWHVCSIFFSYWFSLNYKC